jgi:hypothetical protein
MHSLFVKADRLSGEVIGAATLVHRIMGPGLLESIKLLNVPLGLLFNFHEVSSLTEYQGLSCPVLTTLEQKETKQTKCESPE